MFTLKEWYNIKKHQDKFPFRLERATLIDSNHRRKIYIRKNTCSLSAYYVIISHHFLQRLFSRVKTLLCCGMKSRDKRFSVSVRADSNELHSPAPLWRSADRNGAHSTHKDVIHALCLCQVYCLFKLHSQKAKAFIVTPLSGLQLNK